MQQSTRNNFFRKKLLCFLLLNALLCACNKQGQAEQKEGLTQPNLSTQPPTDHFSSSNSVAHQGILSIQTIPAPENTFGYNILQDGKVFIHQPHLPGLPGLRGFDTETDARKAAELMVHKIRRNIMPPTVSPEELDSLGVLPDVVKY